MSLAPLDAADVALSAAAAALGADAPAARYVTVDAPALDCDALIVSGAVLTLDEAVSGVPSSNRLVTAEMTLWYVACLPLSDEPTVEDVDAAARVMLDRGWALFRALASVRFGDCRARTVGPGLPLAQGGVQGWQVVFSVQVD